MPKHTKSKARLDKWYRIAKEQGYRSRAAFKLIQLNRKYNFLNNANVLVDLCAAPGGWLQVATRYMPVSSIKIGIDLVGIKKVPGCITFQEDITTPRCLALIKKEVKGEKVDVVLNDGAPNVGSNWSKDAYSQVELVLAALKLATTVLKKGGTFVTKVFRSADYNSLIWVLNKFFEKVEATKPAASRTQSAEIFIVCLRYIMPDYIDPKLFDTRFVFKDTEEELLKASNEDKFSSIDKVLQNAQKKNRGGYQDDAPITLHQTVSFEDFLNSENPLAIFAKCNQISFTKEDEEKYLPLAKVPEDYKEIIADLRVQGKREFQSLIKWRTKLLKALGKEKKKTGKKDGIEEEKEEKKEEAHDTDSELEEEIKKAKKKEITALKREREKKLNQIVKLKSQAPQQAAVDADEIEFDFTKTKNLEKLAYVEVDEDEEILEPEPKKKAKSNRDVEDNIELMYELKKKTQAREEATRLRREEERRRKKFGDDVDEEGLQLDTINKDGIEVEEEPVQPVKPVKKSKHFEEESDDQDYEDVDSDDDSDEDVNIGNDEAAFAEKYLSKSKWFDRDIFKQGIKPEKLEEGVLKAKNPIKLTKKNKNQMEEEEDFKAPKEKKDDDDDFTDEEEEKEKTKKNKKNKLKITSSMQGGEKRKRKIRQDAFEDDDEKQIDVENAKIEIVPELRYDDYDPESLAEIRSLATKMLRKKDREQIIEDSYNRYSRPVDEDAPDWFVEDENKHNHKILPITKAEFAAEKARLLEIKNRPIKKIVEAKIRRKFQVQKKLKKAEHRAKDIMEQEGVTEVSKLKQVHTLYRKAMASKKIEKKYVVSRKFTDKNKLNRKTGRNTRMVDNRLKKDKRAAKLKAQNGGKGRQKVRKSKKRQVKRH